MYVLHMSKADDITNVLTFPVPLEEMPALKLGQTTDTFVSYGGIEYNFITGSTPVEMEINTWLPKKGNKYKYKVRKSKSDPYVYIEFLYGMIESNLPVQITIVDPQTNENYYNGKFIITGLQEGRDRMGNITLSLSCKQWHNYAV